MTTEEPEVGDLYPVWWETNDVRPAGSHMARIIEILPYKGPFDFIKCIYRLTAPNTKRGWLDMAIEKELTPDLISKRARPEGWDPARFTKRARPEGWDPARFTIAASKTA